MLLFLMNSLYCGDVSPVKETHQQLGALIVQTQDRVLAAIPTGTTMSEEEVLAQFHKEFDGPYSEMFTGARNSVAKRAIITASETDLIRKIQEKNAALVEGVQTEIEEPVAAEAMQKPDSSLESMKQEIERMQQELAAAKAALDNEKEKTRGVIPFNAALAQAQAETAAALARACIAEAARQEAEDRLEQQKGWYKKS